MHRLLRRGIACLSLCATCALACGGDGAGTGESPQGCTEIGAICDQTSITLVSPANAWARGYYTLDLAIDGRAAHCSVGVTESLATNVQGACSEMDLSLSLTQLCPSPPPTCDDAGGCGGSASSDDCLPGQFQMILTVAPTFGPDASTGIVAHVEIEVSLGLVRLVDANVSPTVTSSEPNGSGCGTCMNASATLTVPSAPDGG